MKRKDSPQDLHLELLKEFEVTLCPDGRVENKYHRDVNAEEIIIGYRDEGPDAWAGSERFSGPAWIWTKYEGWKFYKNGVTVTGYAGLCAKVVNICSDGLHVTNCFS